MIKLTIYSRPGCHLCEEMKAVVARVADRLTRAGASAGPVVVEDVDISTDAELEARYGLEIPVLLVDGRKAAKYRVEGGALERMLAGRIGEPAEANRPTRPAGTG